MINMRLPYISKCGLGKYKIYKNMGLLYISKCGLENSGGTLGEWNEGLFMLLCDICAGRSLGQTSWDGGVLEYIMLLLYNVSPV